MKIFDPVYAFKSFGLLALAASSGFGNTVSRNHVGNTDIATTSHDHSVEPFTPIMPAIPNRDCQVHHSAHQQAPESSRSTAKLNSFAREQLVNEIAAKLTPSSGINEIDALLLPKIFWPTSLNLKYHMYTGQHDEVKHIATNGIHHLYDVSPPATLDLHSPTEQTQQAIHQAVAEFNHNTPFQFNQAANEDEADVVFINTDLATSGALGLTYSPASDFLYSLSKTQSFSSRLDLENQIKAFNREGKRVIILFDKTILESQRQANSTFLQRGDLYHNTILHELLHTIGLTDQLEPCYRAFFGYLPVGRKELNCQSPNQYAKENTIMIQSSYPLLTRPRPRALDTTQYPQSLQPFDYGAVNFIAENIACEQSDHQQGLTRETLQQNPLFGDTTYRFTSDHWVEILSRRCQPLNPVEALNDEISGSLDEEANATHAEMPISNCEQRAVSLDLGEGHIQRTWVDPSGIDTYDFSALNADLAVDLRPGKATTFDRDALATASDSVQAQGNLYQPLMHAHTDDYLIENIRTGSGNDKVYGNQADNYFDLGSSTNMDMVSGEAGRDTFHVSAETGNLYISDFQAGAEGDKLSFDPSFNIDSLAALRARATEEELQGIPLLNIALDANRSVLLKNVALDTLHQDNFA